MELPRIPAHSWARWEIKAPQWLRWLSLSPADWTSDTMHIQIITGTKWVSAKGCSVDLICPSPIPSRCSLPVPTFTNEGCYPMRTTWKISACEICWTMWNHKTLLSLCQKRKTTKEIQFWGEQNDLQNFWKCGKHPKMFDLLLLHGGWLDEYEIIPRYWTSGW